MWYLRCCLFSLAMDITYDFNCLSERCFVVAPFSIVRVATTFERLVCILFYMYKRHKYIYGHIAEMATHVHAVDTRLFFSSHTACVRGYYLTFISVKAVSYKIQCGQASALKCKHSVKKSMLTTHSLQISIWV